MFKKEIVAGAKAKVKSSDQRKLRDKVLELYPGLEPFIEQVIPKKSQLDVTKLKSPERISIYTHDGQALFYQHMDDALIPTLRLAHRFPSAFRTVQIDRGAIRFVLAGATLMVPGLTSPGGRLPPPEHGLRKDDVVVVRAEGKEEACLVGVLKMATEEMKTVGKGVAIEGGHYLGDGLWGLRID